MPRYIPAGQDIDVDDPELVLQEHWEMWQEQMRHDAPDATDEYLRNTVLRAFLFNHEAFEKHRRNMVEIIAGKAPVPRTVEEFDVKLMSPEEHDAHMRAILDDENYAKYREGIVNPRVVELPEGQRGLEFVEEEVAAAAAE